MALVPPHTHPRHEHAQYLLPVGTIVMYAGETAPAGWALCDGSAHGSAELQALLGSANTPDLRDRFVVGAGSTYSRGDTGGAATVALSTANMPAHSHGGSTASGNAYHDHMGGVTGYTDVNHNHSSGVRTGVGGAASGWEGSGSDTIRIGSPVGYWIDVDTGYAKNGTMNHRHSISGDNAAHSHGISPEGSGTAHENRPPYYALAYIIKL